MTYTKTVRKREQGRMGMEHPQILYGWGGGGGGALAGTIGQHYLSYNTNAFLMLSAAKSFIVIDCYYYMYCYNCCCYCYY